MEVREFRQSESGLFIPFVEHNGGLKQVAWAPQAGSQRAGIAAPEVEVGFFGPRGTGKTISLLMSFAQQCGMGYGVDHRGIIFRHSQPQQSEVIALGTIIKTIWSEVQFNSMKSVYTWPGGESLQLGHFDQPAQFTDYIGKSFSFIGFEELCSWKDDKCFKPMFSCLRCANPKIKLMIRSTSNPGGVGNGWVSRRYRLSGIPPSIIGPLIDDAQDDAGNLEPPRRAINSRLNENLLLLEADPNYLSRINASARGAGERSAWVNGDWDQPEGGYLSDIWEECRKTCVVPNFVVPGHWKLYRAGDYGSSKPFSIGWYAVSDGSDLEFPDGKVRATLKGDYFRVSELYGCLGPNHPNVGLRLHPTEVARRIKDHEIKKGWRDPDGRRSRVKAGPMDCQIFSDDVSGVNIANDLENNGAGFIPSIKGTGSRVNGAAQVRQRLEATRRPEHGYRESAGLFICENCFYWLSTVPVLPVDPKNMDDVDTDACDHAFDECRYFCTADLSQNDVRSFRIGGI